MKEYRIMVGISYLTMTCQGCYERCLRLMISDNNGKRTIKPIHLIVARIDTSSDSYEEKTLSFYCSTCATAFLFQKLGNELTTFDYEMPWDIDETVKHLYQLTPKEKEKYLAWETERKNSEKEKMRLWKRSQD
jgi:hypothetical protein